jgi:hypothetical protein
VLARLLQTALLTAVAVQAHAQSIPRPDVSEKIAAPADQNVVLRVSATGSQIYVCQPAPDGKFAWTFKAPEAELHDQDGQTVGKHFAGPTWKANDGSAVSGKATAKVDSPDPDSVPWLLVTITSHSGDGLLSYVASIQRIHTKGGHAPSAAECNASQLNHETKSSYTADYYFYAPAK